MLDHHDGLIFIIDASPDTHDQLKQAMGPHFSYKYVQDSASALSLSTLLFPDLLIVNAALPEIDGFEICSRIHSVPLTANIPVILLLNSPDVQQEARAFSLGAADVLIKPLVPETARARLHRCLDVKRRDDQQENLIALRTVELQVVNKRLVSFIEEHEQQGNGDVDLAKSRFLANMSHEFRTPLNGIMGILQILRDSDVSTEHYKLLEMALNSAEHLLRLVNELLELSKIETANLALKEQCYALREELQPLKAIFGLQARWKGLEFRASIHPDLPDKLICDNSRLRQAIINLLDNALKFTEKGSINFSVAPFTADTAASLGVSSKLAKELPALLVSVSDTGIGIPEDKLGVIFEKFDLGEDYITKKFGGPGLGLAIAKEIIRKMGGAIWVQSAPGVGSTFYFVVPYSTEKQVQPAPPIAVAPTSEKTVEKQALRVLIADADPVNQSVACRFVEKHGHTALAVRDYDSVLNLLRTEKIDVLIIDLQLPGLDGLAFVQRIRVGKEHGVEPQLPIVAVTPLAFYEDLRTALNAGINAVISKPYQPLSLLKAIDRSMALKHKDSPDPAA